MKDIGNYKLLQVHDAVRRLDAALVQLEEAAGALPPREQPGVNVKLERLADEHAALKTSAGRVSARLDAAIERLSGMLDVGKAE